MNIDRESYISLQEYLRKLQREGKGDTKEADEVREDLSEIWFGLSSEDQAFIKEQCGG